VVEMKKYPYPLTVVMDRYSGTYSGGYFTAWNKYPDEIPIDIHCSDGVAMEFWDKYHKKSENLKDGCEMVGFGGTAEEAINDLIMRQMRKGVYRGI
jgi:hypothetical protein